LKKKNLTYLFSVASILLFSQLYTEGELKDYTYKANPNQIYHLDTGIINFEEYNFEQQEAWEYFNIGIIGSAEQKLNFVWDTKKGLKDGSIFFNNYKFSIDKIKRYNVQKFPYSELSYSIGANTEQIARLQHAQNIKNRFKFALDVYGMSGNGAFDGNQRIRNVAVSFYGDYASKNNRYHLGTDFTYSTLKGNETGGVIEDVLTDIRETKLFYTTNLSNTVMKQQTLEFALQNSYGFGFTKLDSLTDSTNLKTFHPVFKIKHLIGIETVNNNTLSTGANDSLYFGEFFQYADSSFNQLKIRNIPHRVAFEYLGTKNTDSISYRNIRAEIALQHNNYQIKNNLDQYTTNNLMLEATVESNILSESKVSYRLNTYYIFSGFNQNDFHAKAHTAYDFTKFGKLSASLLYESVRPSWIETHYNSNSKNWDNSNFKNKKILEGNLSYELINQEFKFEANFDLLNNYVYFDKHSTPMQTAAKITYWNVSIQKNTHWKIWHWNNFIGFQSSNHPEILALPKLFLKTSFFAQFKLFKKNLLLAAGFDLRFNTNFKARAWNPLIAQFYVQEAQTMNYTPVVDVFINAKIKSVRVYMKLNYANEDLFVQNYYKALSYPSNGRTFSFGASWRFFE
tara:strand:+ start:794 stop:2665 length:1872 start_codon:yes stop_codon:yes gene_type:complete